MIDTCFQKSGANQQEIKRAKKSDSELDEYLVDNFAIKMRQLKRSLEFKEINQKPFEYENFDLNVEQPKNLQDDSIFLYNNAKSQNTFNQFAYKYQDHPGNPQIKLDDENNLKMHYHNLLMLGEGQYLNDNLILGVSWLFQKQIANTEKIKIFDPTFYTLAEITDYDRLSTIFFHTKHKSHHQEKTLKTQQQFFHQYDILLIPMNMNLHWYLIYMNLKEKKVYVIDSLSTDTQRRNEVIFLLTMLCTIVETNSLTCNFFTTKYWVQNNLIKVPEFPKQNDGFNCGIFVLMTIYQILHFQGLKKLFHPNNADKFRKFVFEFLVQQHFVNGGQDQIRNDPKPENIINMNFSNEDKDMEEFTNNNSQQYIAKHQVSETEKEERAIVDEIIQVDANLMEQMKSKYFGKILHLMKLHQLKQTVRGDILELWPQSTVTSGSAFLEYYPSNSTIVYPDFMNYVSIYTNTARLNRYYTKCLSYMKKEKNNEATSSKSDSKIQDKNEGLSGTKRSINQADPATISSTNDNAVMQSVSEAIQNRKEEERGTSKEPTTTQNQAKTDAKKY